jgi:AcrR family transcriptional regulator
MDTNTRDGRSLRAATKRRARREQIVSTAGQVFARRGYHGTSIADIIGAAGISRGTFYLYFESKAALFHELLDEFVGQLTRCIEGVRLGEGEAEPTVQIHDNIRRVVHLLFEQRALTVVFLREAVGLDEEVDKKLNALYAYLHGLVAESLKNGAKMGLTRPVNERVVATALIGSIKEVLYQYLVVDQVDIADRDAVALALFDYSLRGLLPS